MTPRPSITPPVDERPARASARPPVASLHRYAAPVADSVRTRTWRSLALGAAIVVVASLLVAVVMRVATNSDDTVARLRTPGAQAVNEPGIVVTKADGASLPATELVGFDGQRTSAKTLTGSKPLVVNFWATTCASCVTEMPAFEKVYRALGDKVGIVGIDASDGVDAARAFVAKAGVTYPVWLDNGQATQLALKVSVLPTTVFVSADGVVRKTSFGAFDEGKLRAAITEVFGASAGAG